MKRLVSLTIVSVLLTGCATLHPSIPDGYTGPTATIKDTAKKIDSGKADIFYLSHIDGKEIINSRSETMGASYGRGNYLSMVILNNSVPAQEHSFTIVGRTEYAMPIRALTGTVYEVKGDVVFSPIPSEAYIVKGTLSEEKSAVWIEKISDGEIIETIEIDGAAKLGVFEK